MKRVSYMIAAFGMFCSAITHAALLNIAPESVDAEAWTVIDSHTQQVIAEHNPDVQRAPASLTKMMVAYIALKEIQAGKLEKSEVLTATPVVKMVMWDESQMYLKEGEQISVDQLLAGLVVMSANDAAVTLAEKISGSVPKFIERMNKEAQALGMSNTHFQNPAGVTMPEHYSTASDIAKLGLALVNQTPDYLNYSQQKSFVYNQRFHRATNLLLKIDPTVDGLKTGFTRAAGYNLAATAHRVNMDSQLPERRLVVVVLGAKNALKRAEVAHHLMNLGYSYTRTELAVPNKKLLAELPVIQSTTKSYTVSTTQPTWMTTSLYTSNTPIDLRQFNNTTHRIEMNWGNGMRQIIEPATETKTHVNVELKQDSLTAPLADKLQLATLSIYQDNELLRTVNIEQTIEIAEASWFEKMLMWFKGVIPFLSTEEVKAKTYPVA